MLARPRPYPHRPRCPFARSSPSRQYTVFPATVFPLAEEEAVPPRDRWPARLGGLYDQLVKRLAAWAAGLPPRTQDLALAALLAVYNVTSLIPETRQLKLPYVAFLLVVLQAAPLTWRRRWPVLVLCVVGIPRALYDQLGCGFAPIPLGPAIAYYTVIDRCSTRVRVGMTALLIVVAIQGQTTPGPHPGP